MKILKLENPTMTKYTRLIDDRDASLIEMTKMHAVHVQLCNHSIIKSIPEDTASWVMLSDSNNDTKILITTSSGIHYYHDPSKTSHDEPDNNELSPNPTTFNLCYDAHPIYQCEVNFSGVADGLYSVNSEEFGRLRSEIPNQIITDLLDHSNDYIIEVC